MNLPLDPTTEPMLARLARELPRDGYVYDRVEAGRFRHAARFRRWRPDREARSCTFDQLTVAEAGGGFADDGRALGVWGPFRGPQYQR